MKKLGYIVFIVLFLVISIVPSAGMLVVGESEPAANEVMRTKPKLMTFEDDFNMDVLRDTSDYIDNRFAFRRELITAQAGLYATVFNQSIEEDVTIGLEDWLFFTETIDIYHGDLELSDLQLTAIAKNLSLIDEYAKLNETELYFTIAPNKVSLYSEYYEKNGVSKSENISKVVEALNTNGITYIDLYKAFNNEDKILYFGLDSHWNNKGAALAHDTILDNLGKEAENFYYMDIPTVNNHLGDMYEMLYPSGKKRETDYDYSDNFDFTYDREGVRVDDITINTENQNASGSLLMFRDSFGNSLYTFMADSFEKATFSRTNPYKLSIMEEDNFDILLIEIVERNLDWLSGKPALMPAPSRDVSQEEVMSELLSITVDSQPTPEMPDYMQISGTIDIEELVSDNMSVYVQMADGERYEATLVVDENIGYHEIGFNAYIKTENCTPLMRIVLESNGTDYYSELYGVNILLR